MADIFHKTDVNLLLKGKRIVLFGDSNMRAFYKDLLWILNMGTIIEEKPLRSKLEEQYMNDSLIKRSKLHNGRDFAEVRAYNINDIFIEFHFLTRCWNSEIEKLLTDFKTGLVLCPDVIIINSCLWDISRWGPQGITSYKDNMIHLIKALKFSVPPQCLVIWTTTLPIAVKCKCAFLVQQVDFLSNSLHFDVMEANMFVKNVAVSYGFDILDIHHHLLLMTHFHTKDGVHWTPLAVRFVTNLILTHIALSWKRSLPGYVCSNMLNTYTQMDVPRYPEAILPNHPKFINQVTPIKKGRKRNKQYRVRPYYVKPPQGSLYTRYDQRRIFF